jgi:hypothetical protein
MDTAPALMPAVAEPFPPVPAALADVGGPALLPLLQQFGQMQQQMMDQFQQTLLMMMQLIHRMHTDQLDLVRNEMQRLREVNLEIQEARLNQQALARAAGPTQPQATPSKPPRPAARGVPPARADEAAPAPQATDKPPAEAAGAADIHGNLAGKIAALEAQRQSIWQRIMGALPGFGG